MSITSPQAVQHAAPEFLSTLRVPLVVAPMLIISGPELVVAACRAGALGAFPTANPRGDGELERWLVRIEHELQQATDAGEHVAPYVPNLIVHPSNVRLADDLRTLVAHRPAAVITSVGSPAAVVPALHDAGIQVWSDVANVHHAHRALEAGVDGLVLLTAGAGGQTGFANPFAFVRAVREFFTGTVILSGGQSDGWALWAAQALGCDLGYMGTRFIASTESRADERYRQMIVESELDDIHLTNAFTGLETNMLTKSLLANGLDPSDFGIAPRDFYMEALSGKPGGGGDAPKRWRDIWSAGHSASGVHEVEPVARIVERVAAEYAAAQAASAALIGRAS